MGYNRSHHFSQCMPLCNLADLCSCNDVHKIFKLATTTYNLMAEWRTDNFIIRHSFHISSIWLINFDRWNKSTKTCKSYVCNWTEKQYKTIFSFIDFVTKYSELISRNLYSCIFKETENKCNFILKMSIKISNTLSVNIVAQKHLRFYYV